MAFLGYHPCYEKDLNFTAIISALVGMIAVIFFWWKTKRSSKACTPQPPGPRGLPLIGYLPFLGNDLHKSFTELAGVYGPVYKLWLGNKLFVVVSSPSLAKEVVRDNDMIFANRDAPIASLVSTYGGNDIAGADYGPNWRKLRKIFVGKMMSNASLDDCYSLRKQEFKNTIRDVYNNNIGKPIDIGELSISTLINVIQNMLWGGVLELGEKGTNVGAGLKNKLAELMVLVATPNISDFFPVLSRFDIQRIERRTMKIFHWFDNIVNCAIEQYRNKVSVKGAAGDTEGKKDFLQFLLELQENEDSASSISIMQIKALIQVV